MTHNVRFGFGILFIAVQFIVLCATPTRADFTPPVPTVSIHGGTTRVDDIGLYGISYRYLDGRTGQKPIGWTGHFDALTGLSALPYGTQNGKSVYLLHPLWHGGTGDTDQTYVLKLPVAKSIALSFSIAMKTDVVGKSDGATFRLFVDGNKLLDQNKTDDTWSNYQYDLSRSSGKVVTLTFEIDPGPKGNSSFDYAFWGDRTISCSGTQSAQALPLYISSQTKLDAPEVGWGSDSPTHAITDSVRPKIESTFGESPNSLFSGLAFHPADHSSAGSLSFASDASIDFVAPDGSIVSSDSPIVLDHVSQKISTQGVCSRTAVFTFSGRTTTVNMDIFPYDGASAKVHIWSDDPYIAHLHIGSIGPVAYERTIPTPYYGNVNYLPELGLFTNEIIDYGLSHASSLDTQSADYNPLTDGSRVHVDETIYYAISPHVMDVFPTPINGPSPYRKVMSRLAVLDYWGGDATGLAQTLKEYATYGLSHFVVLVHDWQHGGYDQQLPLVLPANTRIGGNAALNTLSETAKSLGELLALHENYVDFYPNGPLYDQSEIAVTSDDRPIPAWMWPGHVSYLMTPVVMHKYASMITTQVHEQLGTTASYLDVHSAITPFIHTDYLSTRPGAGMFITMLQAQKDLWQYMRTVHGGPVLGEGNNHWYWSGMLDGVEAQFGTGVPSSDGETAPLFVDFDLLKIHPKQINHGMGYLERWLASESSSLATQDQLDDYRMEEIAYGHSAFVANATATFNLPFIWEEQNLVIPITEMTAAAVPTAIEYMTDKGLMDTDTAIEHGTQFNQVKTTYSNDLTIWANSGPKDWIITSNGNKYDLPKFGWLASSPKLTAFNADCSGHTSTFLRTPDTIYANARTELFAPDQDSESAQPLIENVKQVGSRQILCQFGFKVFKRIPPGYTPFVHCITSDGSIATQFSSQIQSDPATWTPGTTVSGSPVLITLPGSIVDGHYQICMGLYSPISGDRLSLSGVDDGQKRYRLINLQVTSSTSDVRFSPIAQPSPELTSANSLSDFGVLCTNGSVKLSRISRGKWKMIVMPRGKSFTVLLNGNDIDPSFKEINAAPIDAEGKAISPARPLTIYKGRAELTTQLPETGVGFLLTSGT